MDREAVCGSQRQRKFTMSRCYLLAIVTAIVTPALSFAGWADNAFPIKTHDFGTVAVAAKTEFRFPVTNNTGQRMHIQTVRASCGCTTPIIETPYIEPGQTGSIVARFNTDTFRGKRGATLTVVIDRPQYTEVRLRVDGYIRQDMVFHPGSIDFGKINQGQSHERSGKILYAGRDNWSVVEVLSNKPWISVKVNQETRGSQRVTYDVIVTLDPSAPAGYFQDELIVVTNDRTMPRVPLIVSGDLQSALSVSPQSIAIGAVKPGESVERQLVVRGREAFTIESIEAPGFDVTFAPSDQAKATHIFIAKFTANGDVIGEKSSSLTVKTSGDAPLIATALVTAQVRDK
jgi:hypothetical protein